MIAPPCRKHAACTVGDSIVVVGGQTPSKVEQSAWVYTMSTKQWVQLPDTPEPRVGHAVVARGGLVYVIGGAVGWLTGPTHSVVVLDLATKTWRTSAPLRRARQWHSACVGEDGTIYVIGGYTLQPIHAPKVGVHTASVERLRPNSTRWEMLNKAMHVPRRGAQCAVLGMELHVVGGYSHASLGLGLRAPALFQHEVYNISTDLWKVMENSGIVEQLLWCAMCVCKGRLYISGGYDYRSYGEVLRTVRVFNPMVQQWATLPNLLPHTRAKHSMHPTLHDELCLIGGQSTSWNTIPPVTPYGIDLPVLCEVHHQWPACTECAAEGLHRHLPPELVEMVLAFLQSGSRSCRDATLDQ